MSLFGLRQTRHGHLSLSQSTGAGILKDKTEETNPINPATKTELTGASQDSWSWHSVLEEQVIQELWGQAGALLKER